MAIVAKLIAYRRRCKVALPPLRNCLQDAAAADNSGEKTHQLRLLAQSRRFFNILILFDERC
jgi:hypothetical protein